MSLAICVLKYTIYVLYTVYYISINYRNEDNRNYRNGYIIEQLNWILQDETCESDHNH